MTTEELEEAILRGDHDRCTALLTGAPEPQRRAVAPVALRWFRAGEDLRMGDVTEDAAVLAKSDPGPGAIREAAAIATLGTATLTELKELKWRALFFNEQAWDALAERRAAWLPDWTRWLMAENPGSWGQVRRLVRSGLIPTPEDEAYTIGLIGHVWPKSPLEMLRNDPELLKHEVWQFFVVEGGGENSLAARDKYARGDNSWGHALKTLANEGLLSRERLLDASLDALKRDFGQFRAGWFSAFHESLSPTLEERAARQHRYLALLGSRIPPTVSFALKTLSVLDKANRLPGDALVGHLAPALGAREKGTVTLALKLLDRAVKRDPALSGPAAAVACEALLHEKPEVQSTALDLIERHGSVTDTGLVDLVRSRLEDLTPSQRPRAEAWIRDASPAEPGGTPAPASESPATVGAGDVAARVSAIPEKWRNLAGVDAALAALQGSDAPLPAVHPAFGDFPVLDPAARLTPVSTLDDLIDVCASVIENLGPPDEIERMLDGISRLCAERPDDFERRTGPLAKRAAKLANRFEDGGGGYLGWIKLDLPQVVRAWTTSYLPERGKGAVDMTCFHGHRMLEIARRAAARKPIPLLAAPTHSGGWLDPRVLVERALSLQAQTLTPLPFDAIQALLRLAPDHRGEALAAGAGLHGELGDAIRYALGGDGIQIGSNTALWVAAARARAPRGDDALLDARFPNLGPDAARTARCTLESKRRIFKDRGKEYVSFSNNLSVEPKPPKKPNESQPTVMLYAPIELDTKDVEVRKYLATVWPAGKEAWFAQGVLALAQNLDWWEAEWHNRVHLETLLEPDADLGDMGVTLLALGLAAKEPGESGLATDAAIAALRDGRLTGPLLGDTMAKLLQAGVSPLADERAQRPGGMITASRWAKTLAETARASALHVDAVHTALQCALSSHPSLRPADLAALLELLHELSVQLGASMDQPAARSFLESQDGGGKGGKLAKALLALAAADQSARRRAAARVALEGRIERAERWSAMA